MVAKVGNNLSINKIMDKHFVLHSFKGLLLSNTKKQAIYKPYNLGYY